MSNKLMEFFWKIFGAFYIGEKKILSMKIIVEITSSWGGGCRGGRTAVGYAVDEAGAGGSGRGGRVSASVRAEVVAVGQGIGDGAATEVLGVRLGVCVTLATVALVVRIVAVGKNGYFHFFGK